MRIAFCTGLYIALSVTLRLCLFAQENGNIYLNSASRFDPAIEDNSFFIEEAYNQEQGVVQHISTLSLFRKPVRNASYSLSQEWPVGGQTHQLGFTIPYSWIEGSSIVGVGDVLLNYRYQMFDGDDWAAVSPRISLVIPAGNKHKGLGAGVFGVQANLPVSKRLSNSFVVHVNAGATILPNVATPSVSGGETKETLTDYNLGGSIIALVTPKLNLVFEVSTTFFSDFDMNGSVVRDTKTIFSPGIRVAIDIGELQIVPGLAVPVNFSNGETTTGAFFYLSFEHPF